MQLEPGTTLAHYSVIEPPFLSEHDRYLESIRSDPRFARLMERTLRQWEQLDDDLNAQSAIREGSTAQM